MATERILENNRLLWVGANVRDNEEDTQRTSERLREIICHVNRFTHIDDCLPFLENIRNEPALIFISESVDQQQLVQQIHDLPQVEAIFILSDHPDEQQSWASHWSKIRGVHNQVEPICDVLQEAVTKTNENLTPISFVTKTEADREGPTVDLNRLDPSFMYTTLFKRILLDMEHQPDARQAIVNFCRTHYAGNSNQLKIVEEFNRDYRPEKAIWWYTRQCFSYQLLNRALRLLESDIIVDMGFFIHDLHRQLEQLHRQ